MDGNKLKDAEKKEGIEVAMRLKTSINETNMVLFDNEGRITKYKSAKDIMQEFAKVRLKMPRSVRRVTLCFGGRVSLASVFLVARKPWECGRYE